MNGTRKGEEAPGTSTVERGSAHWEERYQTQDVSQMGWFYEGLDPDLGMALEEHRIEGGRALDLGTGPGTQAIALAQQGFDTTGADLSATAIEGAQARAKAQGVSVRFVQDDAFDSKLRGPFDLVLDRGLFHVLTPAQRPSHHVLLKRLVAPGKWLFIKCFSQDEPGTEGPQRVASEEVIATFGESFDIVSIAHTVYQGQRTSSPKALFCALRRKR